VFKGISPCIPVLYNKSVLAVFGGNRVSDFFGVGNNDVCSFFVTTQISLFVIHRKIIMLISIITFIIPIRAALPLL
jgi:hypothetical protein